MDARVTKQRLGNMLSYDWLKILCAIAAAVAALVLFFTMVRPQPARAQKFYVHVYGGLDVGDKYNELQTALESRLSYDVLDVQTETFGTDYMAGAAFTARLSSGEGSVAITSKYQAEEDETSPFVRLLKIGSDSEGSVNRFYDMEAYFGDLEAYLTRFFGENWNDEKIAPVLNAEEVKKCFYARNVDGPNNKNRFRSDAQIEEGLKEEAKRLQTLREDYIFLRKFGLGTERLPFADYTSEIDDGNGNKIPVKEYKAGVVIGGLTKIGDLFSYEDKDGNAAHSDLVFLIYNNGKSANDDGTSDGREDLRFEAVTFLKYLAEQYS